MEKGVCPGSVPDGHPIRPPGPRAFSNLGSISPKPRVPEETGGVGLCGPSSQSPPSPFHSLLFLFPLRDLPECPATRPPASPGPQTLLYPPPVVAQPQGQHPFQPLSARRSVGSFPKGAGFLLYSRRRPGIHGDWAGNAHPKARPIPPDTLVKSLWAPAYPGPCLECLLPILAKPTWERSCPGPRVGARPGSSTRESCRYSTAPKPTALPGSRWKPGAGGAHLLLHCVSSDGKG